jgi:hypothetical protein
MRKFILKFIWRGLLMLSLLVGVNYFGDSAKMFHDEFEGKLANSLLAGEYVSYNTNYDERKVQEFIVSGLVRKPKTLVLGSSRIMMMGGDGRGGFRNSAVSSAILTDLIAVYQMYVEKDMEPEKLIIGVDPWVFNAAYESDRWRSIAPFYRRYYRESIQLANSFLWKGSQLISLTYFQSSWKKIPALIMGKEEQWTVNQPLNPQSTRMPDGSLIYGAKKRATTVEEAKRKAIGNTLKEGGVKNFSAIDSTLWDEFSEFVLARSASGVEVELILIPYHPEYYSKTMYQEAIIAVEKRLQLFANGYDIQIKGGYNPKEQGVTEDDFYDGLHLKKMLER